jgi:hypothetical protein
MEIAEVGRSVLFTCANANQAANAVAVARSLMDRGISAEFMVFDPVYQQGAGPVIARSAVAAQLACRHMPSQRLARPFAALPMPARSAAVRTHAREIIDASGDHDGVVAGMDGAFERLVLGRYRRDRRLTAILWDGLVKRQPALFSADGRDNGDFGWRLQTWWHFTFRRSVLRLATGAGVEAYVPGLAGHTPVDVVFTMGRFVTEAFQSQGVRTPLETTGNPRLATLSNAAAPRPAGSRAALYLTGSFLWHDDRQLDRAQQQDLDALASTLPAAGWHLTIRVHPREECIRYARFDGRIGVTVSDGGERSLERDLAGADVVVTAMSTAGLEALAAGRPLVVFLGAFPAAVRDVTLGVHPSIPVARTVDALQRELARLSSTDDAAALRAVLDDFVAPETAASAGRIADSIAGRLR